MKSKITYSAKLMECQYTAIDHVYIAYTNNVRFLWVDFQLQDICSQATDYDIRAALQHLPTGLPDTYDRLLGKILNSGKKELVQMILRWIACAKRPLSLEELREAISIEPLQQSSEPDRYVNDIAQIPSWCHGLAICDEEDNALQFAHSSIKEFLLGDYRTQANSDFHFVSKTGDHQLGEICVTYLSFSDFQTQLVKSPKPKAPLRSEDILKATIRAASGSSTSRAISNASWFAGKVFRQRERSTTNFPWSPETSNTNVQQSILDSHPFLQYASAFWTFHAKWFNKRTTSTWRLWSRLLLSERHFTQTEWMLEELIGRKKVIERFIEENQHLGLLEWVEESESRFTPAQIDGILESSACRGSTEIVVKVLEVCQSTTDGSSRALQAAAGGGHLQVVERLLDAKADVNAAAGISVGRTALQAAVDGGHLQVVERLRRKQAV